MAVTGDTVVDEGLNALSWVHDELRRSLEAAHKALRRYLKAAAQANDLDPVDPAVLRQARAQLHQALGAVELVGLGPAALLLRASEAALQRLSLRPKLITPASVEAIERGSFALLDYVGRRLANKVVTPLALFPQYRVLQELAGASRIHPADLWSVSWTWRHLPPDRSATPRHPDAATVSAVEADLLAQMRGAPPSVAARMSEVFAGLAAGLLRQLPDPGNTIADAQHVGERQLATLWQLAAAFYEAQADGLLKPDVYSKRIGSRLLAQLRAGPSAEPSQRLAHDLLFFCSQATPRTGMPVLGLGSGGRLVAVRQGYALADEPVVDFETPRLGRFDPTWVSQARKRVAAAKELWSAIAGGDLTRLTSITEQMALVGDSLQRLYPDGGVLGTALQEAARATVAAQVEPPAELAMEVATALLYVDASLDDADFDQSELGQRVHRLAQRIDQVRQKRDPGVLELWMEDLYRRVSDRQTMGNVVQELRASLSEVEKHIDQYFRNPAMRDVLIPVPAQLQAMRGVLSVLGLDQASQAVLRMSDDVDALSDTEADPQQVLRSGSFDRLADNLGALSFLIDMVAVQPQMAKSLFRFDPVTGSLSAMMARQERPSGFVDVDDAQRRQATPDTDAVAVSLEFDRIVQKAKVRQRGTDGLAASGLPLLGGIDPLADSRQGGLGMDAGLDSRRPVSDSVSPGLRHRPVDTAPWPIEDQPTPTPAAPGAWPVSAPGAAPASEAPSAASAQVAPRWTDPVPPASAAAEVDPEMLAVFIDEVQDVVALSRDALDRLDRAPGERQSVTAVRRAFHTLKGSARMVGLKAFGEAAWVAEQLYNSRLADQAPMADAPLRQFSRQALDHFEQWTQAIQSGQPDAFGPDPVLAWAQAVPYPVSAQATDLMPLPDALALDDAGVSAPEPPRFDPTMPASELGLGMLKARVPGLPSAGDLDLPSHDVLPTLPALPALDMDGGSGAAEAAAARQGRAVEAPGLAGSTPAEPEPDLQAWLEPWPDPDAPDLGEPTAWLPDLAERQPTHELPAPAAPAEPAAAYPRGLSDLPAMDDVAQEVSGRVAEPAPAPPLDLPPLDLAGLEQDGPWAPPAEPAMPPLPDAADGAQPIEPDPEPVPARSGADQSPPAPQTDSPAALDPQWVNDPLPSDHPHLEATALSDDAPATPPGGDAPDSPLDAAVAMPWHEQRLEPVEDSEARAEPGPLPDLILGSGAASTWPAQGQSGSAWVDRSGLGELDLSLDEPESVSALFMAADTEVDLPLDMDEPPADAGGSTQDAGPPEEFKQIGDLRIGAPLFNIFLTEADDLSRRLGEALLDWEQAPYRAPGEATVALAHSLAGGSGTVGYTALSGLARSLEHALERTQNRGHAMRGEPELFLQTSDEIRRLLHLFAAGFLNEPPQGLQQQLDDLAHAPPERWSVSQPVPLAPDSAPAPLFELSEFGNSAMTPFSPHSDLPRSQPAASEPGVAFDDEIDQLDAIDPDLFPVFEEEALELLPRLHASLRDWSRRPADHALASACMRSLHTFKGGARLAGAMRLGERAHRLETAIERLTARQVMTNLADIEQLVAHADALDHEFDTLRGVAPATDDDAPARFVTGPRVTAPAELQPDSRLTPWADSLRDATLDALPDAPPSHSSPGASVDALGHTPTDLAGAVPPMAPSGLGMAHGGGEPVAEPFAEPVVEPLAELPAERAADAGELPSTAAAAPALADAWPTKLPASAPAAGPAPQIDWQRFLNGVTLPAEEPAVARPATGSVRVRAALLDRLVGHAGEVSIARARIETDVQQFKGALGELSENLERLRAQLRDIELQAETQIGSRLEAARQAQQQFDPLEMDRFTRFQELTRMMAESVSDVATVQRGLTRTLQSTEDTLAQQHRVSRDMQDDLLRTRLVEFEGLSERLYRVVRQAAKETNKSVRLDIEGGSIEVDRGVLDRMTPAFEHLLRNSVVHGIESPEQRVQAGKDAIGTITLTVGQLGNEVAVEVRDDGGGLHLDRIRERALAQGLLQADEQGQGSADEAELINLIYQPGFTTAVEVTDLAGRGVGMDVVRTEVNAIGGRIETATAAGQGASFRLVLPLTTAVTQVVMLRCGERTLAVPSTLVESVTRVPPAELEACYAQGTARVGDRDVPFFWLDALVQGTARGTPSGRNAPIVVIRSASRRVVLHVDEVISNQEVVVKHLGPQLARLPGLVGITLRPSGEPALIYNPVLLATAHGVQAHARVQAVLQGARLFEAEGATEHLQPLAPLVMVVDDSLTVRRVTQRLLEREGFRVVLAKDGLDAMDKLAGEMPALVLSDIEMPRMDGFDLLRTLRAVPRLAQLPVIMITSRLAQKHRDFAAELGANHYLGKPYAEDQLIGLIRQHVAESAR